ncbi:Aflatoxin biosynthesis regulatory protein [Penicillium odoratum]|uniref:Aflatoxin biosynthesis regulatory protein n=1 Tax=Penicillium odoratum TaxID=1167516 RepID=UPI0025480E49|nr:Aflatoxin biosynthesis regulatory protein [Penicillium odoratum]KAJ5751809.1 Aflatoxin biosynthesis regulatory protein [Penicillium odoratum]
MGENLPRYPGPPKLRSSCDQCGSSKVKCDKGQPECGRCISHGLPCAYGVSRKMGKPPRRSSVSRSMSSPAAANESNGSNNSTSTSSSGRTEMLLELEQSAWTTCLGPTWDPMDEDSHSNSIMNFFNAVGLDSELSMPSFANFAGSFNDEATMEQPNISLNSSHFPSAASSPRPGSYPSPGAYLLSKNETTDHWRGSVTSNRVGDHVCLQRLHEILECLPALDSRQAEYEASPPTASTATKESPPQVMPLDLILQLNRKATEGLFPLVTCSCTRLPHVALLYASIISQILAWYQRAAGCTQTKSPSSASTTATEKLTFEGNGNGTPAITSQSVEITVVPSTMKIGTFNVDDQRLQTAMKICLLLGEMKQVKCLMDQLRSQTDALESMITGVEEVFRSVNSWLGRDYLRIYDMMQLKLRELNT